VGRIKKLLSRIQQSIGCVSVITMRISIITFIRPPSARRLPRLALVRVTVRRAMTDSFGRQMGWLISLHVDVEALVARRCPALRVAVRPLPALTVCSLLRHTAAERVLRAAVHALLWCKSNWPRLLCVDIRRAIGEVSILVVVLRVVVTFRRGTVFELGALQGLAGEASAARTVVLTWSTTLSMFPKAALRNLQVHVIVVGILPAALDAVSAFPALPLRGSYVTQLHSRSCVHRSSHCSTE